MNTFWVSVHTVIAGTAVGTAQKRRGLVEKGVLCFNEGLTRWLQVLPALPRPTPAGPSLPPPHPFLSSTRPRASLVWGRNGVSMGRPKLVPRKSGIRPWRRVVMNDRRPSLKAFSPPRKHGAVPEQRVRLDRDPPAARLAVPAAPGRASPHRVARSLRCAPALAEAPWRSLFKQRDTREEPLETRSESTSVVLTSHVVQRSKTGLELVLQKTKLSFPSADFFHERNSHSLYRGDCTHQGQWRIAILCIVQARRART